MKLKILVDNQAKAGFKVEWDFSCLIELEEKILFDTGPSAGILEFNAKKMGINAESIGKPVLSHDHWGHTGDLDWALQNQNLEVFAVDSFFQNMKELIKRNAELVEVGDSTVEIAPKIHSIGKLKNSIDEQSLAIETKRGVVVLASCSHPCLEKILEKAGEFWEIHAVVGGFNDFKKFEALKEIRVIAATHCTQQKEKIRRLFPKAFVECAAEKAFEF